MISKIKINSITKISLLCALLCLSARLSVPLPLGVPLTFQLFVVIIVAHVLEPNEGAFCIICYLVVGLFGVPVFASGGGIGYFLNPTFGFVVGFLPAVYFSSLILANKTQPKVFFKFFNQKKLTPYFASFCCCFIIHFVGCLYFYFVQKLVLLNTVSFKTIFIMVLTFLPLDLVKAIFATKIVNTLQK